MISRKGKLFSLGKDRLTVGQIDGIWQPRIMDFVAPVVYMHGAGAVNASQANDATSYLAQHLLLGRLAELGCLVLCPTATNTFGNATSQQRITDALAYADSLGVTGPPVLVGGSHGGAAILNYAKENDVAAVVGLLGVVDLDSVRDADILGMRDEIDAAWGVSYPTPLPAGANPADNTADFVGKPIQWWYATGDEAVLPNTVTSFGASTGIDLRPVPGGHDAVAGNAIDLDEVVSFITTRI